MVVSIYIYIHELWLHSMCVHIYVYVYWIMQDSYHQQYKSCFWDVL